MIMTKNAHYVMRKGNTGNIHFTVVKDDNSDKKDFQLTPEGSYSWKHVLDMPIDWGKDLFQEQERWYVLRMNRRFGVEWTNPNQAMVLKTSRYQKIQSFRALR